MRWFSSRPTWGQDSFLANVRLALFSEPVMMRFDFRDPVLIRFSCIRGERGGEMVLFSGDLGPRLLPCVGM